MTDKRFEIREEDITVEYDLLYGLQTCIRKDSGELLTYMEIVDLLNALNDENEQLKEILHFLQNDNAEDILNVLNTQQNEIVRLIEENEQLKKELHLMHMQSMFSTVQSFKGDVSKRYRYSKETDTVYDTANHYGQYDKILDKKEIVMLLNEYETVLNELKGDGE